MCATEFLRVEVPRADCANVQASQVTFKQLMFVTRTPPLLIPPTVSLILHWGGKPTPLVICKSSTFLHRSAVPAPTLSNLTGALFLAEGRCIPWEHFSLTVLRMRPNMSWATALVNICQCWWQLYHNSDVLAAVKGFKKAIFIIL